MSCTVGRPQSRLIRYLSVVASVGYVNPEVTHLEIELLAPTAEFVPLDAFGGLTMPMQPQPQQKLVGNSLTFRTSQFLLLEALD